MAACHMILVCVGCLHKAGFQVNGHIMQTGVSGAVPRGQVLWESKEEFLD
jgi:hypothetical protein